LRLRLIDVRLYGGDCSFSRIQCGRGLGNSCFRVLNLSVLNLLRGLVICELGLCSGQARLGFSQHGAIIIVVELHQELTRRDCFVVADCQFVDRT
jgi:hypothetical protein